MSKPTSPGPGRPRKPPSEKRSSKVLVSLTGAEAELVAAAAGDEPAAVWARETLLRAAKRAAKA